MRNRCRKVHALALALAFLAGATTLIAGQSSISGRLTDTRGAAVPGATVLVFPVDLAEGPRGCADAAPAAGGPDEGAPACALLRSDLDGGFVAILPPGRYRVAAIKPGYEVSITEVHSLASRVVRLRLEAEPGGTGRSRGDRTRGIDWALRPRPNDILRSEDPALPVGFVLAANAPPHDASSPPPPAPSAGLLGPIDGEVTQSVTAGDLPGVGSASLGDTGRSTSLAARAPVDDRLAWSFAGGTARTQAGLPGTDEVMAGGADRMLAGAEYDGGQNADLRGLVRAGTGRTLGGSLEVRDRLLAAAGSVHTGVPGDAIEVAVQAWSARAHTGEGDYVTLDAAAAGASAAPVTGDGLSVYAGARHEFGATTSMRYGVEYRDDSLGGGTRIVPRVGAHRALGGVNGLVLDGEILLDRDHPGGSVGLSGATAGSLRIAALVEVMPEFAPAATGPEAMSGPVPGAPAATTAGRRAIDVSVARDFGPLGGSVAGRLGRTDARSLPAIEEGPMPIVSVAAERYYETRLGLAWRPSETEMQVGYRRVEAEATATGARGGDYRRIDLLVSQRLPAPRALGSARLRALVAWQAIAYDAILAGAGTPVSGLASRLSGGVGLSF
jgi:hypothetical protein